MHTLTTLHDSGWTHTAERTTLYDDPTTPQRKQELRGWLTNVPRGSRVLDFGCGRGEFTEFVASLGFEAIGADISAQAVEYNRRDFPDLQFAHLEADQAAPFEDGSFNAIWSSEVIEHVYDVHGTFAEFSRLLGDGGLLIVTTPYHGRLKNIFLALFGFERHFSVDGQHIRFWTWPALCRVAREHALNPVHRGTLGRMPWIARSFFCVFSKVRR